MFLYDMGAHRSSRARAAAGFSAVELLLVCAVTVTLLTISIPATVDALDEIRTGMATRYLEARIMDARMQAIRASTSVALRFEARGGDYRFAAYRDGNGNGIRLADIAAGIDAMESPPRYLRDDFSGVAFGLLAGVPDMDGGRSAAAADGVRIGASRILTLGPDGTATPGTLYVHGRRSQHAVRILGATGRVRLLRFDRGMRQWLSR